MEKNPASLRQETTCTKMAAAAAGGYGRKGLVERGVQRPKLAVQVRNEKKYFLPDGPHWPKRYKKVAYSGAHIGASLAIPLCVRTKAKKKKDKYLHSPLSTRIPKVLACLPLKKNQSTNQKVMEAASSTLP